MGQPETFSSSQIEACIEQWLEYGRESFTENGNFTKGHHGYYSNWGWAGRCLQYALGHFKHCWRPYPADADEMASFLEGYSDFVRNEELRASMLRTAELLKEHGE